MAACVASSLCLFFLLPSNVSRQMETKMTATMSSATRSKLNQMLQQVADGKLIYVHLTVARRFRLTSAAPSQWLTSKAHRNGLPTCGYQKSRQVSLCIPFSVVVIFIGHRKMQLKPSLLLPIATHCNSSKHDNDSNANKTNPPAVANPRAPTSAIKGYSINKWLPPLPLCNSCRLCCVV